MIPGKGTERQTHQSVPSTSNTTPLSTGAPEFPASPSGANRRGPADAMDNSDLVVASEDGSERCARCRSEWMGREMASGSICGGNNTICDVGFKVGEEGILKGGG